MLVYLVHLFKVKYDIFDLTFFGLCFQSLNPIAWVNIPVFDFRSRLLVGEHKLAMWPVTAELQLEETGCYPLGKIISS